MIANALGANVIAIDIDDHKLELAKELGAKAAINSKKVKNVSKEIVKLSGRGAHVSMDALGSQETCFNSVDCLRKRGKHIQVGLMTGNHRHPAVPMDKVLANELEMIGSHGMQAFRYPDMLEMIGEGILQPQKLVGKTVSLEQAVHELINMDKFQNIGVTVINSF